MRRGLAALAVALAACAEPPLEPAAPLSALPAEAGPLDALNRRHARLRERMRRRGYGPEVGLARELVLEEQGVAIPLDLRVGECSTFAALGGGSIRELSLTLYDGEGQETATDSVGGEGALVHVCPQPGPLAAAAELHRAFHLVIRAREGAGAVLVAQFRSAPGDGDGFDGIFEGILAPRVPFRELEALLARSRSALRARGFSPLGAPLLDRVTEGAVARLPVELEGGRCYVAIGRSDGAQDVDLFLFDGAGVEVDRDLGGDAEPSIEHCPAESGRYTVELRAFEGAGAVGVMVFVGPGLPGESVERIEERRPALGSDPSLAIEVLGAPLRERGFGPPLFVSREAAILPGEVRTHEVVIGPGCSVVIGAASHDGMDLDLYLADEAGREVDRDTAVHSTARVRACRGAPGVLRVAVKAYGRDGAYALAVLRAPPTVDSLLRLRLEEASAPFEARSFAARQSFEAEMAEGTRLRRPLPLSAGECVAVIAAGDVGVVDIDVFLRDAADRLLTSDSGPAPHAAVSRCAEGPEQLTLELAMYGGAGRAAVRVLSQAGPEPAPPPRAPEPSRRPREGAEEGQAPEAEEPAPEPIEEEEPAAGEAADD